MAEIASEDLPDAPRRYFRNELRTARALALADAEAYAAPLHAIERLGRYLKNDARNIGQAAGALGSLAKQSVTARLADEWPHFHRPFPELLDTVRDNRNDVMHVGAHARHLTAHVVEVCHILEDALLMPLRTLAAFMVANPVAVERWQPLSLLRSSSVRL